MAKPESVGAELKRLREDAGLGRERVAAALGFSAKSIERWERTGELKPHVLAVLRGFYAKLKADPTLAVGLDTVQPRGLRRPQLRDDLDVEAAADVLNDPQARAFFSSLRELLHGVGATLDEEDAAVFAVRASAIHAGLTQLDDVLYRFDIAADAIIRYLIEARARRDALDDARHPVPRPAPTPTAHPRSEPPSTKRKAQGG